MIKSTLRSCSSAEETSYRQQQAISNKNIVQYKSALILVDKQCIIVIKAWPDMDETLGFCQLVDTPANSILLPAKSLLFYSMTQVNMINE